MKKILSMFSPDKTFLKAGWRNLLLVNYAVDPLLLQPYVPLGTELDLYENKAYISLVGFLFTDTEIMNVKVPLHQEFEEVNLRFYVKRLSAEGMRKGVVFIRELVPLPTIALSANLLYGENYRVVEMDHEYERKLQNDNFILGARYRWRASDHWEYIFGKCSGDSYFAPDHSLDDFLTLRNWGYTKLKDGKTSQYEVVHPKWRLRHVKEFSLHITSDIFGAEFTPILNNVPDSVIMAEGSPVDINFYKVIEE
jgi:uncharacterized protein